MRFLDRYCTGSGSIHDLHKSAREMGQGGDVLEATIYERGAVVPFGRSQPAQTTTEAMVVVVLSETCQSCFGLSEAVKALAVEDLRLEDVPESLDLAVGPGRADL